MNNARYGAVWCGSRQLGRWLAAEADTKLQTHLAQLLCNSWVAGKCQASTQCVPTRKRYMPGNTQYIQSGACASQAGGQALTKMGVNRGSDVRACSKADVS